MTEKQLADRLFLLLNKVLKLNFYAEYSIPIDSKGLQHRRLDFVGFYSKDRIDIIELKIEPITTDIVLDVLINKEYFSLAKKEFSKDIENVNKNIFFYFLSNKGVTEEAITLLSLLNNVDYIEIKDYTKAAIHHSLTYSRGITPINVLGSIVRDFKDLIDANFIKELQNTYSVYDYYRS